MKGFPRGGGATARGGALAGGFHERADAGGARAARPARTRRLAAAGALARLAGHRHRAAWNVAGVEAPLALIAEPRIAEGMPLLRAPREGEDIVADYAHTGLTLRRHPLALLRPRLERARAS